MARGSSGFIGEILHIAAIRMRINGSGNLQIFLRSLDDIKVNKLKDLPMALFTNIEPTILSNFKDQRVQVEIRTANIDETFNVCKMVVFVKPVAESYPIV